MENNRKVKIKMYGSLFISILFLISSLVFLGKPYTELSFSAGGKSGFYIIILSLLNAVFFPLPGKYALSGVSAILSFASGGLSFYYYRKYLT